jgi:hypothetical protein
MESVFFIGLLSVIVIGSILVSTIAYSRQQAYSLRKSQARQLKHKLDSYQDMLAVLLTIDKEYDLILMVHQQILSMINKLLTLEPENDSYLQFKEEEQIRHTLFSGGKRTQEISTCLSTDHDINACNYQLLQISKLLISQKKKGIISPAKTADLYNHVKKLRLDIEVDSHIAQADNYLKNNDRIMGQTHLKQAREALRNTDIDFPAKADLIKQLSERIRALSSDSHLQTETSDSLNKDQPKEAL